MALKEHARRIAFQGNREIMENTRLLLEAPLCPHNETYDIEELTALEQEEKSLNLRQPLKRERTILISDGRESSVFRLPTLSSVCAAGQVHSRSPYFHGIATRFFFIFFFFLFYFLFFFFFVFCFFFFIFLMKKFPGSKNLFVMYLESLLIENFG